MAEAQRSPWARRREIHRRLPEPAPDCPCCGKKLDVATSIKLDGSDPVPGDINICWGCAAVLKFYGKPLKLRRLEGDELILALANPSTKAARLSVIVQRATRFAMR
jgi:hypothetical protein